jgi:hypothetical protein
MKPDKKTNPKAYAAWVRRQLAKWDPADDRGDAVVYVPRFDGVKHFDLEDVDGSAAGD